MIAATATRNAMVSAIATLVDAGSAGGKLKLRTGSTPGAGTLLATIVLATTAFGSPSSGAIAGASFPRSDTNAAATGTVGNYELTDSDDNVVSNGANVGTSGAEVNLISLSVVAGQTVTLTSMSITQPAGT
jgi:hypothetical protein